MISIMIYKFWTTFYWLIFISLGLLPKTIFDETKMLELKLGKMTCNHIYDLIKSHLIQSHKENSKEKREKLTLASFTDK